MSLAARALRVGMLATLVGLAACSPAPSAAPSVAAGPPTCLDNGTASGPDVATCANAESVVLAGVALSGWTPTRIWISDGFLAPVPDLLFDPTANFPMPAPPDGGVAIGSAEVAFAGTDQHAGMNLIRTGSTITADLTGYAVPSRDWCSGTCATSSDVDGPFRLELVLPHLDWKAGEPIFGTAILSYAGATPITVYGSGSGPMNFGYAEVGGPRKVDPVWTADCGPHAIDPATPLSEPLSKSGATDGADEVRQFQETFLTGPDVRLPAGTWDVTTVALFSEGTGCGGVERDLSTTQRLTVTE